MKHHDTCVLLFVKYPEKGKVKHRLAIDLTDDLVVELYRLFVQDTLETLKKIDATIFICYTPKEYEEKFHSWLGPQYTYIHQIGNDLGERMKNSFIDAFNQGFHRVILIGSDSPDIPSRFLHNAFIELHNHDIVLGPSADGGYYLIGFKEKTFLPSVFEGISWSSPSVFAETKEKIKKTNHHLSLLPVWSDVDTISDLQHLMKRNQKTAFKSSHTITYLQNHKILTEEDDAATSKK
jgi:uncharacterized protein